MAPDITAAAALILPDGCMDVIVVDGAAIVAGPDAVAHLPCQRHHIGRCRPPAVGQGEGVLGGQGGRAGVRPRAFWVPAAGALH